MQMPLSPPARLYLLIFPCFSRPFNIFVNVCRWTEEGDCGNITNRQNGIHVTEVGTQVLLAVPPVEEEEPECDKKEEEQEPDKEEEEREPVEKEGTTEPDVVCYPPMTYP